MICKRYYISGKVQGVFYRDSAQKQANHLGLKGWVRNCVDGRVEMLAYGSELNMATIEKWLKIGPEYAKVTTIEVVGENIENHLNELADFFEVRVSTN